MNDIQIFNSLEFGKVRVIMINDDPWFIAKDVCDILEINNSRQAMTRLEDSERNTVILNDGNKGNPNITIISESGFYALVLSSRKPIAKPFRLWVTSEILPSIRKHGAYMTPETLHKALSDPDNLIQLLQTLKNEQARNKELQTVNAALTEQAHEWNDKAILNALIRAYSLKVYNGIFGNGWNELYKNLQYHEHINLKIRRGHSKDKNKGLIEFIRPDEFCKAVKIAVAMCEKAGIDTYKVINEVNMKNIENDKGDDLK